MAVELLDFAADTLGCFCFLGKMPRHCFEHIVAELEAGFGGNLESFRLEVLNDLFLRDVEVLGNFEELALLRQLQHYTFHRINAVQRRSFSTAIAAGDYSSLGDLDGSSGMNPSSSSSSSYDSVCSSSNISSISSRSSASEFCLD
ncbi:hypothetical protein HRbin20_00480 [bacterium HR20]|nr:hypothetical protein HRbin20_00480 [bacterium HR20]